MDNHANSKASAVMTELFYVSDQLVNFFYGVEIDNCCTGTAKKTLLQVLDSILENRIVSIGAIMVILNLYFHKNNCVNFSSRSDIAYPSYMKSCLGNNTNTYLQFAANVLVISKAGERSALARITDDFSNELFDTKEGHIDIDCSYLIAIKLCDYFRIPDKFLSKERQDFLHKCECPSAISLFEICLNGILS